MKKLITVLVILLNALLVSAQTNNVIYVRVPGEMAYAAYAYSSTGTPLASQDISLRVSILKGSITGSVEYQEIHLVTTHDDGYFELRIGEGTWTAGNFQRIEDIDWGADRYFMKMEIDVSGGYNFGEAGTEAFCSVPYAFHASVADSIPGIDPDSLRMAAQGVGACICSLQGAYSNGNTIITGTPGTITFTGNSFATLGDVLRVQSTGTFTSDVARFQILNNTAARALYARTNGIGPGRALYVQADYVPAQAITTAMSVVQQGLGVTATFNNVFQAGQNHSRVLQVVQNGVGTTFPKSAHAGFFSIRNNTSQASAVRGEIESGQNSLHAQAGSFLINLASNDATSLSAQTVGIGRAAEFMINNNTTNTNDVLVSTHTGTGRAGIFTSQGSSLSAYTTSFGNAFYAENSGTTGQAGLFIIGTNNPDPGVIINHTGQISGGLAAALAVIAANPNSNGYGIVCNYYGQGNNGGAANFNSISNTLFSGNTLQVQNTCPNAASAINAVTNSIGPAINAMGGTGSALVGTSSPQNHAGSVVSLTGSNDGFVIDAQGASVNQAVIRANSTGTQPFANAGLFTNNADQSEAIWAWNQFDVSPDPKFTSSIKGYNDDGASGVTGYSYGSGYGIYGWNDNPDPIVGYAGYFDGDVHIEGSYVATGSKTALVKDVNGQGINLYCEESTEIWFIDEGFGELSNGIATINMDPAFLFTVNTNLPYHVYVQLEGPCNNAGAYVTNKTTTSFQVVQQNSIGLGCNATFSYQIKAKRKGLESLRLATMQQTKTVGHQYFQTYWPEKITEKQNIKNFLQQKAASIASIPLHTIPSVNPSQPSIAPVSSPPAATPPQPLEGTPGVENEQGDE